MERADTLSKLFGVVQAYDPESHIFEIAPRQMGFALASSGQSGGGDQACDKLSMLFNLHWPTGTIIQFTRYTSPDLEELLYSYKRARRATTQPILREITEQRVKFLTEATASPVDRASKLLLHDDRLVISVQVPRKDDFPTEAELRQFQELRTAAIQIVRSAGWRAEEMDVGGYIRFMETVLNQGAEANWRQTPLTQYDENRLICQQLLDPGNDIEVVSDGLWLGGQTRVRVLSPKHYPETITFGSALRYLTDYEHGNRGIRETCMITLNVVIPDQTQMRSKISKGRVIATEQSSQRIARLVPEYAQARRDYEVMERDVLGKGDAVVQCYISMALFNTAAGRDERSRQLAEEASQGAATNAASYWRELGFTLFTDRFICLQLFAQMVPFGADGSIKMFLERYRTMGGKHALKIAPILGPWRGTGSPLLTLISRDGQVQPVSIRDTDTGPHAIVAAQTGSGKTFLAQELISSYLACGGRVRTIDVGYGYKNLNDLLGGQYVSFTRDSRVSLNPFSLIKDFNEEADVLAGIIAVMAAPTSGLTDLQMAGLKKALATVYDTDKQEATIDDLAENLLISQDPRVRDVGTQLFPFTNAGEFGRFFMGRNTVRMDNPFVVLELEELKSRPHLQRVVLMQLLYQIQQEIYQGDRSTPTLVLIDEAWALLTGGPGGGKETVAVIEGAYRKFRRYNASMVIVTQSIADVWESSSGRAIAENSSTYFVLHQKPEAIDAIARDNRLPIGQWGYELLKSVHTVRGEYSEIMCITERGTGIGRLVVSPFNKLLYSSTPDDVTAIRALRAKGMDMVQAIYEVAGRRSERRAG